MAMDCLFDIRMLKIGKYMLEDLHCCRKNKLDLSAVVKQWRTIGGVDLCSISISICHP